MTNIPKERSVEEIESVEIIEHYSGDKLTTLFIQGKEWVPIETLEAERQKQEEFDDDLFRKSSWYKAEKLMIEEAERERIISMLRNGVMTAFSEYNEYSKGYTDCQERMKEIISRELTHPNNPK